MPEHRNFVKKLEELGYSLFSGVPCSFFKSSLDYIIGNSNTRYVIAPNEGSAVAIASGAYLAGKKSAVILQNSGVGNMINPLTSLNLIYKIPVLLIISGRGYKVEDEPQHDVMGNITHELLGVTGIKSVDLPRDDKEAAIALEKADEYMEKERIPYAVIVPKGVMYGEEAKSVEQTTIEKTADSVCSIYGNNQISRYDAISIISSNLKDELVVCTTGMVARELFAIKDRKQNFYMFGSMGHAASLGLGVALCKPEKRVVVLDGDGAFIMHMGIASTIGRYRPKNLIHVVLDNEAYGSTGNQPTTSATSRLELVAMDCNYSSAYRVSSKDGIIRAVTESLGKAGPSMIVVKVTKDSSDSVPRVTTKHSPSDITKNFMEAIAE